MPIDGIERLEGYRQGGYHPLMIGDVLKQRYRIVHKLGHGSYSTIWLAQDEQNKAYVAVKISIADSNSHEAAILSALSNLPHPGGPGWAMIPTIQDQFESLSPNGTHACYVTAPAQCSVADAQFARLFPMDTARVLVASLVLAVSYIHNRGFVHGGKVVHQTPGQ